MMSPTVRGLAIAVASVAAVPAVRHVAASAPWIRGRGLILLYHRVLPRPPRPTDVVPAVTEEALKAHIDAIAEIAEIVPLVTLLSPARDGRRVRVAFTFDDDDPAHIEHALPILRRAGVPATFFLSGRALSGLPPYWWVRLEEALAAQGVDAVARRLGVRGGIPDMAKACEDPRVAERLTGIAPAGPGRIVAAADIRTLTAAGMTVGFHTLRHFLLPMLSEGELRRALEEGRERLSEAAGSVIDLIAYPYGQADAHVAQAARRSGFRAGFVSGGRAVARDVDPFCIPRWEPGPLGRRRLLAEALLRLHRRGALRAA